MSERTGITISLGGLLAIVASFAVNFWLFRLGAIWGILGLNVSKHVVIAVLCQRLGVDRRKSAGLPAEARSPRVPGPPQGEPAREIAVGAGGDAR